MSQLIQLAADGQASIVADTWVRVTPPAPAEGAVRKQAGKVVLFKLTGEETYTAEQIANTEIPASGKVLLPLVIWQAHKDHLQARLAAGEIGIILSTNETV